MVTSTAAPDAPSALDEVAAQASPTLQKLRDQTDAVVQRLRPQIDAVSTYARDEPTKALLIAAATGAALMGLVALMSRSGSRMPDIDDARSAADDARSAGKSALATLRDAALDLADRAHSAASDAMGGARKTANTARKRAGAAADDASGRVSDALSEAWHSLRDQAAPVVDKLRPQLNAATDYAKDEPVRAALGVIAAGAALVGLFALLRNAGDD